MSLIVLQYIFSAGATIIASQHNTNNSTIYNDYNGNIVDINIASGAAIANSKLNLSSIAQNVTIAGTTQINGTLQIGTTHQGDLLYDNGTSIIRLVPGTSGQFLKTQGAASNPIWSNISSSSNVIFQYIAIVENVSELLVTTLTNTATALSFRYLAYRSSVNNTFYTVWKTKFIKISGVNTATIYAQIWGSAADGSTNKIKVDIGGLNTTASGTLNQTSPEWVNFTIDISSLTNSTVYDVTVSIANSIDGSHSNYMGNLVAFGS